ncbi:MAG: hypothetical protein MUE73_08470 [Planctomycetes bacterium]|jgi:hypothetical protein|nr:hypothetical protein [Planctomycetota bacterium]
MKLLSTLVLLFAATASMALPVEAGGTKTLRKLGLKAYWSVLDDDQKTEAKKIGEKFLLETAADRLAVEARVMKFRADVTALLSVEQRRTAAKVFATLKKLDGERKKELFSKLLDRTDRAVLSERVDRISGASPPEQVELGLAIHDQLFEAYLGALAEKLALTADQQAAARALYDGLKADLKPTALRLAEEKSAAVRAALALLRPEQKEKLDSFREDLMGKVLDFLRG